MGRPQQYEVRLSHEEREYLERNSSSGDWSPRQVKRALILLKVDRNQKNPLTAEQVAWEVGCSQFTVNRIREGFSRGERLGILADKPRSGRPKIIDGDIEAHIIATACSSPPEGRVRWTLELIAEKIIALKCIEECSPMSISRTLKKMKLSLG
jgi:transposase